MVKSHRYCVTFSGVIREQLRELEQFTCGSNYQRNQMIYCMDDPCDELYLIDSATTVAHLEYKNCTFDRWLKICEDHTLGHINQMKRNY